jgi:small multidrug resistance pump
MAWLWLAAAIVAELASTLGLRGIAAHPHWWSVTLIALGYALSFAFMTPALRQLNVGVVYAVWSAAGTAAIAVAGTAIFGDRLNAQAIGGIALIVIGVVALVSSGAISHG